MQRALPGMAGASQRHFEFLVRLLASESVLLRVVPGKRVEEEPEQARPWPGSSGISGVGTVSAFQAGPATGGRGGAGPVAALKCELGPFRGSRGAGAGAKGGIKALSVQNGSKS